MSRPITWQNINAPDFTASANMLGQAQKSINGVFTGAQDLFKDMRDIETGNQENQVRLNTNDFEKQLRSRYKTAEELQSARESDEVEQLRGSYGPNGLNTDRTNAAAVDNMVTGLQNRQTSQFNYNQTLRDQTMNPIMEGYKTSLNSIDSSGGISNINKQYDTVLDEIEANPQLDAAAKNSLAKEVYQLRSSRVGDSQKMTGWNQTQTDRQKRLNKEEALESADMSARTALSNYKTQLDEYNNAEQEVLSQWRLTRADLADEAITSQIPNEDRELINSKLAELGEMPTEREMIQNLSKELEQNKFLTNEDIKIRQSWLQDANFDTGQLTKTELAEQQRTESKIMADYKQDQNEYANWAASEEPRTTALNRIIASTRGNWEGTWDDELIYETAYEMLTTGLVLEGRSNPVPLPPGAVEYLLNRPDLGKFWSGKDPQAIMEALNKDDYWQKQLSDYDNAKKEISASRTAAQTSAQNSRAGDISALARQYLGAISHEQYFGGEDVPLNNRKPATTTQTKEPTTQTKEPTGVTGVEAPGFPVFDKKVDPSEYKAMDGQTRQSYREYEKDPVKYQAKQVLLGAVYAADAEVAQSPEVVQLLDTLAKRGNGMQYSARIDLESQIARLLPTLLLENPKESNFLENVSNYTINKERKRRNEEK